MVVRVHPGVPEDLDFAALVEQLNNAGFNAELAERNEPHREVVQKDVHGLWQVAQLVLDHAERDAEAIAVGILAGWAGRKISRKQDPAQREATPTANLWGPHGELLREVELPTQEAGDEND
jgi:hypothetical protein